MRHLSKSKAFAVFALVLLVLYAIAVAPAKGLEGLSVILEIVAFSLVTVDLYGEQRLEELKGRLDTYRVRFETEKPRHVEILRNLAGDILFFLKFCFVIYVLFLAFAEYVCIRDPSQLDDIRPNFLQGSIRNPYLVVAIGAAVKSAPFFGFLSIGFPLVVYYHGPKVVAALVLSRFMGLSAKVKFKGALLICGAITFILSKMLAMLAIMKSP